MVPADIDLRTARALDTSQLELIILPTEKCNFRCTYCYENFNIGRMQPRVVSGIKNWMSVRSAELRSLYISWFGGEPLLALDLILEINRHAQQLSRSCGFLFNSGITTNGWLLDDPCLRQLTDSGVYDFQITLDGPELVHNRTRRRANGLGTFSRIYHNLEVMRNTELRFHVNLRIHLLPSNFETNRQFVFCLAHDFGSDLRFDIFPHTVRNLGGSGVDTDNLFTQEQHKAVEAQIYDIFYAASGRTPADTAPERASNICYAAKANSFIVRPDGRIGKCTVDLYNDRNTIGRLKQNGQVEIDNHKLSKWIVGLFDGNEQSLTCPLSVIAHPAG